MLLKFMNLIESWIVRDLTAADRLQCSEVFVRIESFRTVDGYLATKFFVLLFYFLRHLFVKSLLVESHTKDLCLHCLIRNRSRLRFNLHGFRLLEGRSSDFEHRYLFYTNPFFHQLSAKWEPDPSLSVRMLGVLVTVEAFLFLEGHFHLCQAIPFRTY
jgi:hypothetical protein